LSLCAARSTIDVAPFAASPHLVIVRAMRLPRAHSHKTIVLVSFQNSMDISGGFSPTGRTVESGS
jgi:hypothetical protein